MNHAISYEVNQLGGGRWQRAYAADEPAAAYASFHISTPPSARRFRLHLGMALVVALVFVAAATLLGFASGEVSAGLSSYGGAGGSYPLVAGLSGGGSLVIAPAAETNNGTITLPSAPTIATQSPTPTIAAPLATGYASNGLAQRKPAAGDYTLLGKPSISVATIEQVLKQYNSPAMGSGQTFYDLGVKYGVDPAFMLAFFIHESAAGTAGAAVETKSVGNIICAGWSGRCIGRFRAYDSYAQAAEDWYQLITSNLYIGAGLDTPEKITPRYAPDADNNNSAAYAKTVERLVDEWRAQQ